MPTSARLRRGLVFFWLGLAIVTAPSCGTVKFYRQAIGGQAEIWRKSRPNERAIADPAVPEKVKAKLRTVAEIRDYADRIGLPARKQYASYADLGRPHVVWVVTATPEFSTELHTWWYPIIGRLKYRGFFSEREARTEAGRLKGAGLEVSVSGVDAYSTLGYFNDPVLNTFVNRSNPELAELILHELTHQRLYLSGDTDFNEALATAVGQTAAQRWLAERGDREWLARYRFALGVVGRFYDLALSTRDRLEELYRRAGTQSNPSQKLTDAERNALRREKAAIVGAFERKARALAAQTRGVLRMDRFFAEPVNNARLSIVATYFRLVPDFQRQLTACGGDFEAFFSRMEALGRLPKAERLRALKNSTFPMGN